MANGPRLRGAKRPFAGLAVLLAGATILGGCQLPTFFSHRGATKQGHDTFLLYSGTVMAAIVVGGIVALLILWSVLRYRRRDEHMPKQFQYHVPLEIFYTIVPILIVLAIFAFTVVTENEVDAVASKPALTVNVAAFQWGWSFEYPSSHVTVTGGLTEDPDPVGPGGPGTTCAPAQDCYGPGLVLPAGETATIHLISKDVVHGFYVPAFDFSRYAQPGVTNTFDFTVKSPGVYRAQCSQICGLYHSEMFFHVVAMPPAEFQAWLAGQRTASSSSQAPLASARGASVDGASAPGSTLRGYSA